MNRKILSILGLLAVFLSPVYLSAQKKEIPDNLRKLGEAIIYIDNYYIDTLEMKTLTENTLKSLLNGLDPHSSYISADDAVSMNEPLEGEFEGIGIEFAIISDTLTVQATISGGPSSAAGIIAGDKIIAVDTVNIAGIGITNADVRKYLRGPKGSKVNLSVKRKGSKDVIYYSITRDKIPIESVDAYYQPSPGVLYIKLGRFSITSAEEIFNVFSSYGKYPKGVILDLRGNSGGFLYAALTISNFFLKKGEMILYTEGANSPRREEYADGRGVYTAGPLVVMVDENSASASEIVAGAIQDWDRGIIVGRRTFGKGLVQRQFSFNDGSKLRLTVARYHTPSGRVIQSPYEKGHKEDYYKSFYERFERGESFVKDSIHFPDSLKYKTLKFGKTVYGGGGIMPEIFVPRDTAYYSEYYSQLIAKGVINDYVNKYLDTERKKLHETYKDFDIFMEKYSSDNIFEDFIGYAAKNGVDRNNSQITKSEEDIKLIIKALVARSLFGKEYYYRVINSQNQDFQVAFEIITSAVQQIDGL